MAKPVKYSASKPIPQPATVNYSSSRLDAFRASKASSAATPKRKSKGKPGGGS